MLNMSCHGGRPRRDCARPRRGVVPCHVPTETLIRYVKEWQGGLMGDKTWSALFDNSKVKSVAGPFEASQDLDEILSELDRSRERAAEGSGPGRKQGGSADGPDHCAPGRAAAVRAGEKSIQPNDRCL